MAWSVDANSYDWKKISSSHMLEHTLAELEKRRGGILLMHDVQPKTALTLPALLRELKARGYRIVHVVPRRRRAGPRRHAPAVRSSIAPARRRAAGQHRPSRPGRSRCRLPSRSRGPGGNGLFEAIFTASPPGAAERPLLVSAGRFCWIGRPEARMVPFFVQIKCQLGKSYEVANRLADAEIASEIYSTAGEFDLLIKVYVDSGTDIGHFVNEKVQRPRHPGHPHHHHLQGVLRDIRRSSDSTSRRNPRWRSR